MEVLSETDFAPSTKEDSFIPNLFVDVSNFFEKKIEIMKEYKSEIDEHPFPRSEKNMRSLGTLRGARCGVDYAESFVILIDIK